MKVIVDAQRLTKQRSGVGEVVYQLMLALSEIDHHNQYALLLDRKRAAPPFTRRVRNIAITHTPSLLHRLLFKARTYRILPPMDIFFGRGVYFFPNFVSWPLLFSPSIVFVHDLYFIEQPQDIEPKNLTFLQKNVKRSAQRARLVLVSSQFSKKEVVRLFSVSAKKVKVLPFGIDPTLAPQPRSAITRVRKKYSLPSHYFLFVGTLDNRKNLPRLIAAYSKLPATVRKKHALVLMGGYSSEQLATISPLIKDLGKQVILTGFVDHEDKAAMYSGATAFCFPSLYEGFGLPVLEAMACGCPVITSNNTSLAEVANGAALAIDPTNIDELTTAMQKIVDRVDLRETLTIQGREQAAQYSWEASARKFLHIIEELENG